MVTVYVTIRDGVAVAMANATSATEAVYELQWFQGEVYACRVSESAAVEIRQAIIAAASATKATKQTPLSMLKMYSQSMQKCADVT